MPGGSSPTAPGGGRFRGGDAIRGLASLLVITYHVAYFGSTARVPFRAQYGSLIGHVVSHFDFAVYPFFALSGYLVGRGFVRRFVDTGVTPSLSSYGIRRALRVLPGFWVAFSVLLIWFGTLHSSPWDVASVYLFAQNYHDSSVAFLVGPAWTLDIEAVFYVALPVLFIGLAAAFGRRLDPAGRRRVLLGALTVVAAVSIGIRPLLPHTQAWAVAFPETAFCFIPGIALAAIEPLGQARLPTLEGRARPWRLAVAVLTVIMTALYFTGSQDGLAPAHFGIEPVIGAAAGSLWVGVALMWEWSGSGVVVPFSNRALGWIGERSFSLYVIHTGVLFELIRWHVAARHPVQRFLVLEVCTLAGALFAATVMWHLVEQPAMALGQRLTQSRRPTRADIAVGGA